MSDVQYSESSKDFNTDTVRKHVHTTAFNKKRTLLKFNIVQSMVTLFPKVIPSVNKVERILFRLQQTGFDRIFIYSTWMKMMNSLMITPVHLQNWLGGFLFDFELVWKSQCIEN